MLEPCTKPNNTAGTNNEIQIAFLPFIIRKKFGIRIPLNAISSVNPGTKPRNIKPYLKLLKLTPKTRSIVITAKSGSPNSKEIRSPSLPKTPL